MRVNFYAKREPRGEGGWEGGKGKGSIPPNMWERTGGKEKRVVSNVVGKTEEGAMFQNPFPHPPTEKRIWEQPLKHPRTRFLREGRELEHQSLHCFLIIEMIDTHSPNLANARFSLLSNGRIMISIPSLPITPPPTIPQHLLPYPYWLFPKAQHIWENKKIKSTKLSPSFPHRIDWKLLPDGGKGCCWIFIAAPPLGLFGRIPRGGGIRSDVFFSLFPQKKQIETTGSFLGKHTKITKKLEEILSTLVGSMGDNSSLRFGLFEHFSDPYDVVDWSTLIVSYSPLSNRSRGSEFINPPQLPLLCFLSFLLPASRTHSTKSSKSYRDFNIKTQNTNLFALIASTLTSLSPRLFIKTQNTNLFASIASTLTSSHLVSSPSKHKTQAFLPLIASTLTYSHIISSPSKHKYK